MELFDIRTYLGREVGGKKSQFDKQNDQFFE